MPKSFRSLMMLGTAVGLLNAGVAMAGQDPLLPEGVEPPAKGRELMLPPMLNEAPPGAEIVLPPPGQEAALGAPSVQADKVAVRATEDQTLVVPENLELQPVQRADAGAIAKTKAHKAKAVKPTEVAVVVPAKIQPLKEVMVADAKSTEITQTDFKLAPPQDGMGGPELVAPPSSTDNMEETASAENAPAIQRLQLAQATAAPRMVDPSAKSATRADNGGGSLGWEHKLGLAVGYGQVEVGTQTYLGIINEHSSTSSGISGLVGPSGFAPGFIADDQDEFVGFEIKGSKEISDWVEPLIDGATSWIAVSAGGFDADFSNSQLVEKDYNSDIVVPGVGGYGSENWKPIKSEYMKPSVHNYYLTGYIEDARYDADLEVRYGKLIYGETWKSGSVDLSAFGGFGFANRSLNQRFVFSGDAYIDGSSGGYGDCERHEYCEFYGQYDTDIDVDTYSFILGLAATIPLDTAKKWAVDGYAKASYDISRARGHDSLKFEYETSDCVDCDEGNQSVRLRKTDEGFGYGAGVGLNYNISSSWSVRLGADYHSSETSPIVIRDGINASTIGFERETEIVGTLGTTLKF